jgi:hypothetical protein
MRPSSLSFRFYLEAAVGLAGVALFVVTLFWNQWIEIVFNVDPDAGNGSAEILVSVALLVIAAVSWWMARTEWRRLGQPKALSGRDTI